MASRSLFITFEGPEGSGKSTQARMLAEKLEELGYEVVLTQEPGGSIIGTEIRELLLNSSHNLDPWTEVFLYLSDRREHVVKKIFPALSEGKIVISDRFIDSTLAYQGFGKGLPVDYLWEVNLRATDGLVPHITFVLDVDVREGLKRKGKLSDRFETLPVEFHERVREGYLQLVGMFPERVVLISQGEVKRVAELIFGELKRRFKI